jgi:hypothetical protein
VELARNHRDLRCKSPVVHTAAHDRFWVISKYGSADIARFTPAAVKKWEGYLREITTFCIA